MAELPNYNILDSTTASVILQNLSCCISAKSKEINAYLLQGNLSCYKKEIKNLAILETYYSIIKDHLYTRNYIFSIDTEGLAGSITLRAVRIINKFTNTVIGYATGNVASSESIMDVLINYINDNSDYTSSYSYDIITRDITVTIESDTCYKKEDLWFQQYTPVSLADPTPNGSITSDVQMIITQTGICPSMNCFDSDDLQTIYKQVINLCQFCINCQ
jgi:hypothetical protein